MNSPIHFLLFITAIICTVGLASGREISRIKSNATKSEDSDQELGELLLVQFVFRHGDRTPYWFYKNDHYQEKDFWEGEGQMINRGKERMFRYGKVLKRRYSDYISDIYLRNIIAESSPIRRCIETSQAVLAGFFPPNKQQVWSQSMRWPEVILSKVWQPIAVTTVEESRSWKLNPDCPCPTAQKIEKQMETDVPELKQFLAENHEFMEVVGKYTGEDYFHHWPWLYVGYLYDTLFTEKIYFGDKFIRPEWLDKVGPDTYAKLSKFNNMVFSIYGQAPEFVKLRAGTFLNDVVQNFKEAAKIGTITAATKKIFTYGSHDTMEAYILHALGMFKEQPTYGSGLIFELRKPTQYSQSAEPQVHLYYSNVTNNFDIYPLNLNESARFRSLCPLAHCSLTNFATSLEFYLEDQIEQDCQKLP